MGTIDRLGGMLAAHKMRQGRNRFLADNWANPYASGLSFGQRAKGLLYSKLEQGLVNNFGAVGSMIQARREGQTGVIASHLIGAGLNQLGPVGSMIGAHFMSKGVKIKLKDFRKLQKSQFTDKEDVAEELETVDKKLVDGVNELREQIVSFAKQVDSKFTGVDVELRNVKAGLQSVQLAQRHLVQQFMNFQRNQNQTSNMSARINQMTPGTREHQMSFGGHSLMAAQMAARGLAMAGGVLANPYVLGGGLIAGGLGLGTYGLSRAFGGKTPTTAGVAQKNTLGSKADPTGDSGSLASKDVDVEGDDIEMVARGDISLRATDQLTMRSKTISLQADKIIFDAKDIEFRKSGLEHDMMKLGMGKGKTSARPSTFSYSPTRNFWNAKQAFDTQGPPPAEGSTQLGPGNDNSTWPATPGVRRPRGMPAPGSPNRYKPDSDTTTSGSKEPQYPATPSMPDIPGYDRPSPKGFFKYDESAPTGEQRKAQETYGPGSMVPHFMQRDPNFNPQFGDKLPNVQFGQKDSLEGIHPNALAFIRNIGVRETNFREKEAYSEGMNKPGNNVNVAKYGKAGADYGYYQTNQFDVTDAIKRGVPPEIAMHLHGGGAEGRGKSTPEQQTLAMHEYLKRLNPKAYEEVQKGNWQAGFDAFKGKWPSLPGGASYRPGNESAASRALGGEVLPGMVSGEKRQPDGTLRTERQPTENIRLNPKEQEQSPTERIKVSAEEQQKRPDYWRGTLKMGEQEYRYGTGAPGATGGSMKGGSVPYGTFDINSGLHYGPNTRLSGDSFGVKNMFDPKWGRMREGILLHSASNLEKLYTAGCLGIDPRQWPAFRKHMLEMMEKHGPLVLNVDKQGNASVVPKSQQTNPTQSTDQFLKKFNESTQGDYEKQTGNKPVGDDGKETREFKDWKLDELAKRSGASISDGQPMKNLPSFDGPGGTQFGPPGAIKLEKPSGDPFEAAKDEAGFLIQGHINRIGDGEAFTKKMAEEKLGSRPFSGAEIYNELRNWQYVSKSGRESENVEDMRNAGFGTDNKNYWPFSGKKYPMDSSILPGPSSPYVNPKYSFSKSRREHEFWGREEKRNNASDPDFDPKQNELNKQYQQETGQTGYFAGDKSGVGSGDFLQWKVSKGFTLTDKERQVMNTWQSKLNEVALFQPGSRSAALNNSLVSPMATPLQDAPQIDPGDLLPAQKESASNPAPPTGKDLDERKSVDTKSNNEDNTTRINPPIHNPESAPASKRGDSDGAGSTNDRGAFDAE